MDFMAQLGIIGEVALAMLLGGLIGLEREVADKPAGFRTQMLVAGAAALLVGLANAIIKVFLTDSNANVTADPVRIVEAIVAGVSFLGAGTIFRSKDQREVEGLTTAASILLSAAIGISVALRQFVIAVGVTLLALAVLRLLSIVEKRIAAVKDKKSA